MKGKNIKLHVINIHNSKEKNFKRRGSLKKPRRLIGETYSAYIKKLIIIIIIIIIITELVGNKCESIMRQM